MAWCRQPLAGVGEQEHRSLCLNIGSHCYTWSAIAFATLQGDPYITPFKQLMA